MSLIEQIRDGLEAKLQAISGIGTVEVAVTPKLSSLGKLPAAFLWRPDIQSDDEGQPMKRVERTARWPLALIAESEVELEDLIVAATAALETDQTLGGLGFLGSMRGRAVLVEAVDIQETTAEVARRRYPAMLTVRTIFLSMQGEL